MEVAILTTVLGAVLSTVLPRLLDKALGIIKEPDDLFSRIEELINEMVPIREEIRQYHSNRSKELSPEWRSMVTRLRHLAYQIEDCLDEIKIEKITTTKFTNQITALERSLRQHFDEMKQYMRQGHPSPSSAQDQRPRGVPNHDGLVGIEELRLDLLALARNNVNPAPMVISIIGVHGVSNALAAEVYNDPEVHNSFPLRVFASATGKDKDNVLVEILHSLINGPGAGLQAPPQGNERYFIVIDDVQEEALGCHVISWFRQATDARGIIVVTTTEQSVAVRCSSGMRQQLNVQGSGTGFDDGLRLNLLALVRNYVKPPPMVISIVGFGGVGKSSLAAKVYDDLEVRNSFPLRVFVRATGKDKDDVLIEIFRKLHNLVPGVGFQARPQGNKRYFIVIDDVQEGAKGCHVISWFRQVSEAEGIIVVTTTVQSVAESCSNGYGHVYKMRQLNVEESGKLFRGRHHILHPHVAPPGPRELESMGVGKECDGIPLALISMAEFWNRDPRRCKTAWRKFFDTGEDVTSLEEMCRVLEQSYNSLPSIDAETCLHYFSLFPSGYPIRKGALLRRWMAEGAEVGCNSLTDNTPKALKNLKTLIDRNVIWPVLVSTNEDQDAMTCRPSRAMLGFISDKSKPEGFVSSKEASTDQHPIRRLSLQTGRNAGILENKPAVSRLRTLVVSPGEGSNVGAAALSFDNCELLRVLDLQACHGPQKFDLNGKICKKLKLLKYLSLRADIIGYVPKEITQLNCLETLDVGKEKVAVLVHVDVITLPCLKHLVGKFQLKETILSKGRKILLTPQKSRGRTITGSKLETLAGFVTLEGKGFPPMMHQMTELRKVKIFFDPNARATSFSDRLAKAITAFLPEHADPNDEGERRSLSIDLQESIHQEDVLGSLAEAQGTLYSLKLSGGHKLMQIPLFIGKLNDIVKLCLSFKNLRWRAILDGLGNLPQLKYLKLVAKLEFEGVLVYEIGQSRIVLLIQRPQFIQLQRMCLQTAGSLPKIEIQSEALNSLVSLHLICGDIGVPAAVIYNAPANQTGSPTMQSALANQTVPTRQSPPAHQIPPLRNLKEVAIQSSHVRDLTKKAWHEASRGHPNRPQVMFIEDLPAA